MTDPSKASKQPRSVKSKSSRAKSSQSTGPKSRVTETCEPSPPSNLFGMELDRSTSSLAASRAKTLASLEGKLASRKEPEADYGPKSCDLLASYDRNSSSWRTSQTCFVDLANGPELGLAEFSGTWPNAGMMRSGKTYRRQPWALPIAESVSGLLLTTIKTDGGLSKGAYIPN